MQAIVQHEYGSPDVLKLDEIDKPIAGDDDVLVQVRGSSVNPADWHTSTGTPYLVRAMGGGFRRPKRTILGSDVAGRVEAVGKNVSQFQPGDDVFGIGEGAYAQYVCASEALLEMKPANMTFEQAAAVPIAAFTALQGLRDHGQVQPGQRVLINGASGGVGTFAVQIAKTLGADVTAVCSTRNVDMVRSIGADQVVDYTQEDFTQTGDARYDVLIDNVGNRHLSECRRALSSEGVYVMIGGPKGRWLAPVPRLIRAVVSFKFVGQKFRFFVARSNKADLTHLKELIESGSVMSVIDRQYSLSEVPEALRYLGEGHSRGKSVITV